MDINFFKKNKLPDKPGVYFFKKGKETLYIGKATSLKDRVKSYFVKDLINTRGPILVDLVFQADKIIWKETDSVLEALILEASLIKKYQPKYNTKEKSDKSFNYVCITKENIPKVLIIREKNILQKEKNNKFQAKYGPFTNGSQLKEAMKIIRPIFPYFDEKSDKKENYKFYSQLGLVPDINENNFLFSYKKNIKNLNLFFQGKKKNIISNFKKDMMLFAKNKEFEKAGEVKKKIFALKHINDIALLKYNIDTKDILPDSPRKFSAENFLCPSPSLLPRVRSEAYLSKYLFSRIEAYDIAHMSGKNMVGVMTVLENREVVKEKYRKFKIKTQKNANDTGALKEILERRFAHNEWTYPIFIVVDGGIAQINIAKNVLSKLQLNIPIVSVLKDDRHKAKAIMGDKNLALKYKKDILLVNSEAHRFAINYHKNLRNKNFLK